MATNSTFVGLALDAAVHHSRHVTDTREEWSSVFGWISVACWVVVYSPQIYENYSLKSGEGLSIAFVVIWLAGDILNWVGAIRQGLLWTMIVLGLYYTLCDIVLICQYYYYQRYQRQLAERASLNPAPATERSPLLASRPVEAEEAAKDEGPSVRRQVVQYALVALLVAFVGTAAWIVSKRSHEHRETRPTDPLPDQPSIGWRWDAQISGWLSAVLYLCSRIPQIFKNRTTYCAGLSLALFVFAVAGNATYVASILLKSTDRDYLIQSASWLVGSGGTILLDFIVLYQFVIYRPQRAAAMEAARTAAL